MFNHYVNRERPISQEMITRIDEYIVHVPNLQPLTPRWYILSDAEHAEPAKCGEVGRSSMRVFLNKNHGI